LQEFFTLVKRFPYWEDHLFETEPELKPGAFVTFKIGIYGEGDYEHSGILVERGSSRFKERLIRSKLGDTGVVLTPREVLKRGPSKKGSTIRKIDHFALAYAITFLKENCDSRINRIFPAQVKSRIPLFSNHSWQGVPDFLSHDINKIEN